MNSFILRLASNSRVPSPSSRRLLAYFHSGDVLRQALPVALRTIAVIAMFVFTVNWLQLWPPIYRELERWSLVKEFFAQLILFGTALLLTKMTFLRASHLKGLPADDFVSLRALAVLCRWWGEIPLVLIVGLGLSSFLHPLGPLLRSLVPEAFTIGAPTTEYLVVSASFFLLGLVVNGFFFLFFYSLAAFIDVTLAIEFNTRADRVGQGLSLGGR